jgi:hypothetical protein
MEILASPQWGTTNYVDRLKFSMQTDANECIVIGECHSHWNQILTCNTLLWSLVWCVCFVDRCLSFYTFSFGHCVVCSSSIYRFVTMQTFPSPLSLWDQHIRPRVSSQSHCLRIGFIHVNKNDDFELSAHDEPLKKPSTCTCTIRRPESHMT